MQIARALFDRLRAATADTTTAQRTFQVHLSYLMLRGEKAVDLLKPDGVERGGSAESGALVLKRSSGSKGLHMSGATRLLVSDARMLEQAIAVGEEIFYDYGSDKPFCAPLVSDDEDDEDDDALPLSERSMVRASPGGFKYT